MKKVLIILISAVIFIGCAKEEDNSVPVVHLFQANPASVETGGQITLTVLATDEDGDQLSYIYQSGNGSIDGSGDTVKWTAPKTPGKYSIKVNVSDGKQFVQRSIDITVIEKEQQPTKDGIIVPGEQASGIMIGDTLAKAEKLYGKGEQQVSTPYILYIYNDLGITLVVGNNLIYGIFVFGQNKSKTAGGNGVGSTLVSIKKELGEPEEIKSLSHWYWTKGIEVDYNDGMKAGMIFVFVPSNPAPMDILNIKKSVR